jgi:hypothetical protein
MAFSFPTSPTLNQTYTFGTKTWRFNGTGWVLVTGVDAAQSAWSTANLAYVNSNAATVLAQGAFDTANSKFDKAGGTITGNTFITKDLTVGGNLSVLGNTFSINAGSIQSNSTVLLLGIGNYATDALDIGFAGHYNAGVNAHTGLIRDSGTKEWYLFKGYQPEIVANNNIIISDPSFTVDTLHADLKGNTVLIKTIDILPYANSIYDKTNAAFNSANSGFLQANSAFIQTNAAFDLANAAYLSQNATGHYANSAFVHANAAYQSQNATGQYANSGFVHANASFNHANAAYAAANNVFPQIQPSYDTANAAFIKANSAFTYGNATANYTNSAFAVANSASTYANSAFAAANAAGSLPFVQFAANTANAAFIRANNSLDANNGGSVSGTILSTANVRADYVVANTGFASAAGASRLQLSDIGIVSLQVAGQEFKFGASGIEASTGIFGGSYGGNRLSLNNETNLRSDRYDVVKIQTGTDGTTPNEFIFSNNSLTVPGGITANGFTAGGINVVPKLVESYDQANSAFETANSASIYANGAFTATNVADGKAVASGNYANAAFIQANVGITHAQSAFIQANSAYESQNATGQYANSAFVQANAAFNHANASYAAANNVFPQIQPAYNTANAAFVRANNSLDANVGGSITGDVRITGNLIVTGNTVYANAQTVLIADNIITLNAAINQSAAPTMNAGIEVDRGNQPNVYVLWNETEQAWQFTNNGTTYENFGGGSAGVYANGAFIQANSASVYANGAFVSANLAWNHANAAFNKANTGGSGGANVELQILQTTADGTNSTYALGFTPSSANAIDVVSIGGIVQTQNLDYYITASNGSISFYEPPPVGEIIRVTGLQNIIPYYYDATNSAGAIVSSYNGVGDGTTNTFALGFQPASSISVFVTVGGIVQPESAYTTSNVSNTITFVDSPGLNENIRVVGFTKINPYYIQYVNSNVSVSVYETTANGNTTTFPLNFNPQAKEFLQVTIDGIVQPLSVYSVNTTANTITFDSAPSNNELVRVATFYTAVNTIAIQLAATNTTVSTFETTANGLVSTFALGFTPVSNQALVVAVDGVLQAPSTYSIDASANTITFDIAPVNNEYISVTTIGATNVYVVNDGSITYQKLGSSVTNILNYATDTANSALIYANAPFATANSAAIYANGAFVTANAAATTGKAIAMSIVFGG